LLKDPASKIMNLDIGSNPIESEYMVILTDALSANSTLKKLQLDLCNPVFALEELQLGGNHFDDEGGIALGNAMAQNTRLKTFDVSARSAITPTGWRTILAFLHNPDSAIECLGLTNANINDEVLLVISNSLIHSKTLRSLMIGSNVSISSIGWKHLFRQLLGSVFSLEILDLSNNQIDDEGADRLTNLLVGWANLNLLNLAGVHSISNDGLGKLFSRLLLRPRSKLKTLLLPCIINDEVLIDLAVDLANNIV